MICEIFRFVTHFIPSLSAPSVFPSFSYYSQVQQIAVYVLSAVLIQSVLDEAL
jgi:hypothetical protein